MNKIIVTFEDGLKFEFDPVENSNMVIGYLFRLLATYSVNNFCLKFEKKPTMSEVIPVNVLFGGYIPISCLI